ncbi:stage III sporulation protein SpoIIIAB [Clostridium sp. BJN0001]|uniref:stage III sporulation protein SpoIIIAB n=1 Tax=Clostridium sp. BJN0001 TaxID=2930219 RepID=UPI001FD3D165|nr:stage III sporulation protein SpoIIIAB [Clostridium sp. BJN0001]
MFKIMLLLIIFCISSYIGITYADSFKLRTSQLKVLLKAVLILENDVIYGNTPIPESLNNLIIKIENPFSDFLKDVSYKLTNTDVTSVYDAFSSEFDKYKDKLYLKPYDVKILKDFLKSLGTSLTQGQEKVFNLAIHNIKININESEEIEKKNSKLYRYLGVLLGAIVCIFLI